MKETPPAIPKNSNWFSISTSIPRNIVFQTLSKSPCDTTMIHSSLLAIISSKRGFKRFHSSRLLSASENILSSMVFSWTSMFSRSHWTDLPTHLPKLRSRSSVLMLGVIPICFATISAVCFARRRSETYITILWPDNCFANFCPILSACSMPNSERSQSVQEPTIPFVWWIDCVCWIVIICFI